MCKCGCGEPLEKGRPNTAKYRLKCSYRISIEKVGASRRGNKPPTVRRQLVGYKRYHAYIIAYLKSQ